MGWFEDAVTGFTDPFGLTRQNKKQGAAVGLGLGGFALGGPAGAMAGLGMAGNMFMQDQANEQNMAMAKDQRDWMTEMSNTAHQREVADLKAAGLNPELSGGGNGSSTPSAPMATVQAPQIDLPSIMSVLSLSQNQQKIDIDKANSAAAIAKSLSEQDLNKMKKILLQKGMIRAELEGEASDVVSNMIKFMKERFKKVPDSRMNKEQSDFMDNHMIDFNQRIKQGGVNQ